MNDNTLHDVAEVDAKIDALLRSLDSAPSSLTDDEMARGEQRLRALLGAAPDVVDERGDSTVVTIPLQRKATQRRGLRLVGSMGIAASLAVAITVASWSSGDRMAPAFASWTPEPSVVGASMLQTAEKQCRESMAESLGQMGSGLATSEQPTLRPETARTVTAERRGDFVFLAMVAADDSSVQCFFNAADPAELKLHGTTGGLATAASAKPATLASGEIDSGGAGMASGRDGTYAFSVGRVASDVGSLTLTSAGVSVKATVSNGYFAAWWPAPKPELSSADPGAGGDLAYSVTLIDGTVVAKVHNVFDDHPTADPTSVGAGGAGGASGAGAVTGSGPTGESTTLG